MRRSLRRAEKQPGCRSCSTPPARSGWPTAHTRCSEGAGDELCRTPTATARKFSRGSRLRPTTELRAQADRATAWDEVVELEVERLILGPSCLLLVGLKPRLTRFQAHQEQARWPKDQSLYLKFNYFVPRSGSGSLYQEFCCWLQSATSGKFASSRCQRTAKLITCPFRTSSMCCGPS